MGRNASNAVLRSLHCMDNALGREPEETWDLLLLLPQPPWEACPAVLLLDRHTHPLLVSLEVCWSKSMALAGCEADFQCLLMLFIQIRAERVSTAQRKKRREEESGKETALFPYLFLPVFKCF